MDNLTHPYLRDGTLERLVAGARRERLAAAGAHPQRPLWASTSTKNPALPDTAYVDGLIGPDTVTTLPEATITAFEQHGTLARTIDVAVDMDDVGRTLEDQGVAGFRCQGYVHPQLWFRRR